MKIAFNLFVLMFSFSCFSFSQGRGDQIFDESYIHEIRVTTELDLDQLFDIYISQLFVGEYTYTISSVEIDGNVLDSVGVRVKGGVSGLDPKKPLKLDFNSFVAGKKYDGIKKLNLHQGNLDPSFIREALTYGLLRNGGIKTARTSFAKVYFNDVYQGLYTLIEQIDNNFIKNRFASGEGALYKTGVFGLGLKYEVENPLPYDDFVAAVNQIPTNLLHEQLSEYLDVESFLRFFATEIFVMAVDGPLTVDGNYYIYYEPKSGTYVYIPWDYNLSLYGGANHSLFESNANFLLSRVWGNSILRARYLDIFCQLLGHNFDEDRIMDVITNYQELLKDEVPNDPFINVIGDWDAGVEMIRNVISSRVEALTNELNQNLNSCPPVVNPLAPFDLVINEVVASNDVDSGIKDPNGGSADWIELYNNTSADIDLRGLYLSNDRDVLKHWRIPQGTTISANDYLIIWADRDLDEEGLHTDFKLNKSWDELILSYENGEIIDEVILSNQETNIGFARVPNGTGDFIKQEATFNATNSTVTLVSDNKNEWIWDVSPNPFYRYNALIVNSAQAIKAEMLIYNMDGKLMFNKDFSFLEGPNQVDVSQSLFMNSGVYSLVMIEKVNGKRSSQKLVVIE